MRPAAIGGRLLALAAAALLAACFPGDDGQRAVGQLESERVEIAADVAERIVEIPVVEGQEVTAGTLLLRQDSARIAARVEEAEALLAEHRARLDELVRGPRQEQIAAARAAVAGAERELEFRRRELERASRVLEQRLASPESVDIAQAAHDSAVANLDVQRARLDELLEGTTIEELRQAESAVRRAEAQVTRLALDEERHAAHAPADGVVDTILFEPGERPAAGQPMIVFLTGSQPHARIYVPEAIRVSVGPGSTAQVHVDGLAAPLEGRVRWVASEAAFTPYFALTEKDRGRLSYAAEVDLVGGLPAGRRLPDGVPVEVAFDLEPSQ